MPRKPKAPKAPKPTPPIHDSEGPPAPAAPPVDTATLEPIGTNLIPNGDFRAGFEGWHSDAGPDSAPEGFTSGNDPGLRIQLPAGRPTAAITRLDVAPAIRPDTYYRLALEAEWRAGEAVVTLGHVAASLRLDAAHAGPTVERCAHLTDFFTGGPNPGPIGACVVAVSGGTDVTIYAITLHELGPVAAEAPAS